MEEAIAAFLAWWMALQRGKKRPHTNGALAHLNSQCQEMKGLFTSHFKQFSPSKLNFHKFHDVGHAAESITEFGPVACTSAQLEERAHQQNTKSVWKKTNKRDAEKQMGGVLFRKAALEQLKRNEHPDMDSNEVGLLLPVGSI